MSGCLLISGDDVGLAAELLLIAITGWTEGCGPEDADPVEAWLARRVLASGASIGLGSFFAAYALVGEWGDFIRPWFGLAPHDLRYGPRMDVPPFVGTE